MRVQGECLHALDCVIKGINRCCKDGVDAICEWMLDARCEERMMGRMGWMGRRRMDDDDEQRRRTRRENMLQHFSLPLFPRSSPSSSRQARERERASRRYIKEMCECEWMQNTAKNQCTTPDLRRQTHEFRQRNVRPSVQSLP